ncbi:hypothetical protein [Synechococcus sp. CS-1328]|uniref:hypothetical protein n=1 Tax=Synechococcus sp. CS-1328 TaxID=2847976 RepID=UPI00223C5154|nr:hypothetical protein [Synechococcus sp. CS-1328]
MTCRPSDLPPQRSRLAALLCLGGLVALIGGCVPAHRHPSWALYALQRRVPHDGLAVVSQPDGYGLHLWLDTDTRQEGVCKPRWNPNPARLFNGNGTAPFSSGLATQQEFFAAVARPDVQRLLRSELEALCAARAPRSSFTWVEPPRRPQDIKPEAYPQLEEADLLSDPEAVLQQERKLLGEDPPMGPPPAGVP